MTVILRALFVVVLGCVLMGASVPTEIVESKSIISPYGPVRLFRHGAAPNKIIIYFSGDAGWTEDLTSRAEAIAGPGTVVVGIDLPTYIQAEKLYARGTAGNQCLDFSSELPQLIRTVALATNTPRDLSPLLLAAGDGGAIAFATAAQSRMEVTEGLIAEKFCPVIHTQLPPCPGPAGVTFTPSPEYKGFLIDPAPAFRLPFVAIADQKDCAASDLKAFTKTMPDARIVAPVPSKAIDLLASIVTQTRANLARSPANSSTDLTDLPLVEIPSASDRDDRLVIVLTGDGGWADIDKVIGERLAARGVAVVGFNTLKYFWKEKTPNKAATDLERIARYYMRTWKKRRVIMVGFSFGANVLPFIVPRLPPDLRRDIPMVALLAPGPHAYFEISVGGWIGEEPEDGPWLAPAIQALHVPAVLCIHGADERKSSCPARSTGNVEVMILPGGHHFGGDYEPVVDRILAEPGKRPSKS